MKARDRFIRYYLSELVDMIDRGPAAIQVAIDEGEHKNFLHALDLARDLFREKDKVPCGPIGPRLPGSEALLPGPEDEDVRRFYPLTVHDEEDNDQAQV